MLFVFWLKKWHLCVKTILKMKNKEEVEVLLIGDLKIGD